MLQSNGSTATGNDLPTGATPVATGPAMNGPPAGSPVAAPPPIAPVIEAAGVKAIQWTAKKVVISIALFILAGLAEIGGGWLVWQTVRNHKPWYYLVAGGAVLVCYGLVPTLQPEGASFSRVYAVYGGVFVVMSYGWGWAVDGDRPDTGDYVGAAIALAGVASAWFWPR